jgi:hypothetical protein
MILPEYYPRLQFIWFSYNSFFKSTSFCFISAQWFIFSTLPHEPPLLKLFIKSLKPLHNITADQKSIGRSINYLIKIMNRNDTIMQLYVSNTPSLIIQRSLNFNKFLSNLGFFCDRYNPVKVLINTPEYQCPFQSYQYLQNVSI